MRLSLEWLSDFVQFTEKNPEEIARRLTLCSAEIEEVETQGALLKHCCVGKILAVLPHPNANKLRLADVETDKGTLRVVCGGTNLREGMLVAFAHIGATVKHGDDLMTLTEAIIRGETSNGMLCAAEELELQEQFPAKPEDGDRPIIDLGRLQATSYKLQAGAPLGEVLGLTDTIFHVNNTAITNRPDLFSHLGFARECVAQGLGTWKKKPASKAITFPKKPLPFGLHLPAKKSMTSYAGCALDIAEQGVTPAWMKKRLEAVGSRSISLPVDITNYVMWEQGTPMHSFDRDDIKGDVTVRVAEEGETIVTLDGSKRTLPEGALILSDGEGIFDLVCMMGGERSSMKDGSRRLFIQAPVPDAALIRRTMAATNHRTDAATIAEKGIPASSSLQGFMRTLELFLELVPGAEIVSACESWNDAKKPKAISLEMDRVCAVIGIDVADKEAQTILEHLGHEVAKKGSAKPTVFSVTPAPWRVKDINIREDLIDDIARIRTLPLGAAVLGDYVGEIRNATSNSYNIWDGHAWWTVNKP